MNKPVQAEKRETKPTSSFGCGKERRTNKFRDRTRFLPAGAHTSERQCRVRNDVTEEEMRRDAIAMLTTCLL
jgi:hypothetical protein